MNNRADTIRLLRTDKETAPRWTAREWVKERRGWIFLTSTPETRDALKPIISLWLDLLILRLLHEQGEGGRRVGKGKKDRMVPTGERALAWVDKYIREVRPNCSPQPRTARCS